VKSLPELVFVLAATAAQWLGSHWVPVAVEWGRDVAVFCARFHGPQMNTDEHRF